MGDNFSLSRGRSLARHALEKERVTKPKERPRGRLGCNFGAPCQIVMQAQTGLEWTGLDWTSKTRTSKTRTRDRLLRTSFFFFFFFFFDFFRVCKSDKTER